MTGVASREPPGAAGERREVASNRARISSIDGADPAGTPSRITGSSSGSAPAGAGLVAEREHVAVRPAPHLLAAGRRRLARGELQHRSAVELDELVDRVHERRVGRHAHLRPDPERVHRRARPHQLRDLVLVQPAAREDPRVREPGLVEQLRARLARELVEVAAVQPHADPPVELAAPSTTSIAFRTPFSVSYVSTRNVVRSG